MIESKRCPRGVTARNAAAADIPASRAAAPPAQRNAPTGGSLP
jgi:hypothetical protein